MTQQPVMLYFMKLQSAAAYARVIKSALPEQSRLPAPTRALLLPVYLAIIGACIFVIGSNLVPLGVVWLLSIVLGMSFAGLTFLAHETLHGAVVHGRRLQGVIGWFSFLPFVISPVLWRAWHNRLHHGQTNKPDIDPDAYPTLQAYETSATTRFVTHTFAPGHGLGGVLALLIGFSVQSGHMLVAAREMKLLSPSQHRIAIAQTLLATCVWVAVGLAVGWVGFLFAFVLPLGIANVVVMAHILTNHSLSPLTETNDPLVNSLTVTVPRWFEWYTLGFGYHVEHHLFPGMSSRNAPAISQLLREHWPERYQSLPLTLAVAQLYRTPRVYKTATTLVNVTSGEECRTLGDAPELSNRSSLLPGATGKESGAPVPEVGLAALSVPPPA